MLHTTEAGCRIQRRRECQGCGHRFNTFESSEDVAGQFAELKKRLGPVLEMVDSEAV